jgi:hypothetical protein
MNTTLPYGINRAAIRNRLPALLRVVGTGAVIVAMYSFLVRGWDSGNDVSRYLMMLAHTALLAGIGLASGYWLQEGKGARQLLTLALVSVPANFAILGAFIYSRTAPGGTGHYPHYVAWSVDSLPVALATAAAALVVLVPVTLLGFRVLARGMSRELAMLFLLSNLALLLPLRDPHGIGLLVAVLTGAVVWFSRSAADGQAVAGTREGITALGMQLLPLGVLLGRSLWLYAFDLFLATLVAATVFAVLRQCSLYLKPGSRVRALFDGVSLMPALAIAPLGIAALSVTGMLPDAWLLPAGALLSASLVYDIARRSERHPGFYRRLAVLVVLAGPITNLWLHGGLPAAAACLVPGGLIAVHGYRKQQLSLFAGGLVLVFAGLAQQFFELLRHFDLAGWAGLAVLGTLSIVFASVLESRGGRLRGRLALWREHLQAWRA